MVDTYNLYQLQGRIHRLMNVLFILHTQNFSIAQQKFAKAETAKDSENTISHSVAFFQLCRNKKNTAVQTGFNSTLTKREIVEASSSVESCMKYLQTAYRAFEMKLAIANPTSVPKPGK